MSNICPLCHQKDTEHFWEKEDSKWGKREYFRCSICALIFVPPHYHLSQEEEKARYDTHQNSPDDSDYVTFLERLTLPLLERIPEGASGLDFGCGPGPAISFILEKKGVRVENYDPYYFPDKALFKRSYDFVTSSEVFEHLRDAGSELKLLSGLIRKGGWLGIMTQILREGESFADWWYHKDPTHICFYQPQTFQWVAEHLSWKLECPSNTENVVFFQT